MKKIILPEAAAIPRTLNRKQLADKLPKLSMGQLNYHRHRHPSDWVRDELNKEHARRTAPPPKKRVPLAADTRPVTEKPKAKVSPTSSSREQKGQVDMFGYPDQSKNSSEPEKEFVKKKMPTKQVDMFGAKPKMMPEPKPPKAVKPAKQAAPEKEIAADKFTAKEPKKHTYHTAQGTSSSAAAHNAGLFFGRLVKGLVGLGKGIHGTMKRVPKKKKERIEPRITGV
jgi:hypothetical protein